ncbi:ABC transporter permease [Spirochaeta cellobiosiphila]|uniref:ABC transporter permease n=1 Tax=Spirochaeta cellobiosiphila TaxID=504483 RepID=UPI000415E982|nr:ABC transporter permease subunit [Spirochaeta cellobiosiphila]
MRNKTNELKKHGLLYLMAIPACLFFILNSYLPMFGIYLAFTKYNFRGGIFGSPFIGFENFKYLLESGTLFRITRNTFLYNLVFILLGNSLQIVTAILLSKIANRFVKRTTQSLMFLPYFVSYVILGVFVYNLLNYEKGLVNSLLIQWGMERFDAFNTPLFWIFGLIAAYIWKWLGYGTVIYLAAISGIPEEYYEAANIDGANAFQQIRYITLPSLKPTFITLLLLSIGRILRGQFDLFFNIIGNNGVLFSTTDVIDTFVYRSVAKTFDIGLGSAAGLYQSLFGFALIMIVNGIIKHINEDYALF